MARGTAGRDEARRHPERPRAHLSVRRAVGQGQRVQRGRRITGRSRAGGGTPVRRRRPVLGFPAEERAATEELREAGGADGGRGTAAPDYPGGRGGGGGRH